MSLLPEADHAPVINHRSDGGSSMGAAVYIVATPSGHQGALQVKGGRVDGTAETGAMPIDNALVTSISTKLSACSNLVLEAGKGIVPWTIKRNRKSAVLAAQQLGLLASDVNTSLVATLVYVCRVVGEAQDAHLAAREQNEERVKLETSLEVASTEGSAKDERIESLVERLTEAKTQRTQQFEHVTELVTIVEKVVGDLSYAQKREEPLSRLALKLTQLLEAHSLLQSTNDECTKENISLSKKVKELSDKQRDHDDVQGRENRRLASELKKAISGKESSITALKHESAAQLLDLGKEGRSLQRRYSSLKLTSDASRESQLTAEANTAKAVLALSKSQDEVAVLKGKLGEARASKADMGMQLQAAGEEVVMMRAELDAAGMASKLETRYMNKALPFPRSAFSTRGGVFLHSRVCSVPVDTTRVVPYTYVDHHELALHLVAEGLHLCHCCRLEPGF